MLQIDTKRVLIVLMLFASIFAGCAKNVTVLPNIGNQLNIEITFRGDVNSTANKYYLIFGSLSPNVPYKGMYGFAPGESYDLDKLNAISSNLTLYYTNYFSSWNDFVLLNNDVFYLTKGPFVVANHASFTSSYLNARILPSPHDALSDKKIALSFSFYRLSVLPSDLYFNFVAVDPSGIVSDYLRSSDNKINVNYGTSIPERLEPSDSSVNPSLDIISWSMSVQ